MACSPLDCVGTVPVFRQKSALEDAISLPTPARLKLLHVCATNGRSCRVVTFLPVDTFNNVTTLKAMVASAVVAGTH